MISEHASLRPNRHIAGIIATVAMHVGLLLLWQWSNVKETDTPSADGPRIQWVDVRPARPVTRAVRPVAPPAAASVTRRPPPVRTTVAAPAVPPQLAEEAQASEPMPAPMSAAPPARTADEIMQQARRDIGSFSKDLKKEFPGPKIRAPVDTPQSRLVKGIALAHELAPPKWYEANKVKELNTGSTGTRRYQVTTSKGTYCITVGPTHTRTGLSINGNANPMASGLCPQNELPPSVQNYDERP